jgi:sortase A
MRITRALEYGAWAVGAALLLLYGGGRLWLEASRADALDALRAAAVAAPGDAAAAESQREAAAVDQSLWSSARMRAFAESLRSPGLPVGALLIPSLGLEVPIYPGATELNLNRGAAHIEGTAPLAPSGNVGIAAHRDGFFRGLEHVRIGEEIVLEVEGRPLRYQVVDLSIVQPTDVHVLDPTPTPSVTLVTCYPFYFVGSAPERYIVRAELIDAADGPNTSSDEGHSVHSPSTIPEGAQI